MSFVYPLGLLGLIGVPILILIYIIKNKYTEQTVSSTYIWTYSEQFLKRRKKLPKIAGLISLILQILAVVLISLLIAHPVFTFPDAADEYCIIIDGSGSMHSKNGETTRFELGKKQVAELIDDSMDGGLYTVIYVGDSATNVICEREDDKDKVLEKLDALKADFGTAKLDNALKLAQNYFYENRALRTYLVTDKNYQKHKNIEVINVNSGSANYGVSIEKEPTVSANRLTVTAKVTSYGASADLKLRLYVDGETSPELLSELSLGKDEAAEVTFVTERESFSELVIKVESDDVLGYDNEILVYNVKTENEKSALVVSETPFFFTAALGAVGDVKISSLSPKEYEKALSGQGAVSAVGYGLYVFDSYAPPAIPRDGAVWLVNQTENINESGFSVQGEVTLKESVAMQLTDSTSTAAKLLTQNMRGEDVHVYKYMKYGLYENFTTVYSYNKQPLIFAGTNVFGNREVVFAFSMHDTNFALLADYAFFISNLVRYSFPDVLERTSYTVGDKLEINIPANCTDIKVESPMGNVQYPASSITANELVLDEPGTYTVTLTVGGTERRYRVFSEYIEEEREVSVTEKSFSLVGDAGEGGRDGIYDDLIIFVIVLAVIMMMDWMVYCYDKYQLR